MISFLLNPVTASIGIIVSALVYWLALHSGYSHLVGDFFNLLAPCVQGAGDSIPCQAKWNIHVGMTALVAGIIWAFILVRWAVKTFGRIFLGGVAAVIGLAVIVALLSYAYLN